MDGCARAAKRKSDAALSHAWHVEAFARQKTLPKLEKLLGIKAKPQSTDDMLAVLQSIASKGAKMNIKQLH